MNNPSSLEAHLGNAPGAVLAWRQRATPWVAHWRVYVHDSMQILLLNSAYLNLKHRATAPCAQRGGFNVETLLRRLY
jgi:hypothetical protein